MSDYDWEGSAGPIWALVCGLPKGRRECRLLFMLRAFVDDSRSFGEKPVFVLGGYLSEAAIWAKFSDAWQAALDERPRIRMLKMRDALKRQGEFFRWPPEMRDAKIARLRRVIEDHDLREFSVAFRVDHFRAAFPGPSIEDRNPFFFAKAAITTTVARGLENFGFPREPITFIFDNQVMEKDKVIAGFEWARRVAKPDPPDILSIIRSPPSFEDDSDVLPLQAADMHAVWVRSTFDIARADHTPPPIPGSQKQLRGFILHFNEEQLRRYAIEEEECLMKAHMEGRF